MKTLIMSLALSMGLTTSLSLTAHANTRYSLDAAHSTVGFNVAHLMISKVNGRFDKFDGEFTFDLKTGQLESLQAKVDVDTINTNEVKRDKHLRDEDFFAVRDKSGKLVEAKRWMTFKTTAPTKVDLKGKATPVKGELTINGVTQPVILNIVYRGTVTDPWGKQRLGFEATTKINRKDYNLTWNKALETGGFVVGEDVEIALHGEATAAATATK